MLEDRVLVVDIQYRCPGALIPGPELLGIHPTSRGSPPLRVSERVSECVSEFGVTLVFRARPGHPLLATATDLFFDTGLPA